MLVRAGACLARRPPRWRGGTRPGWQKCWWFGHHKFCRMWWRHSEIRRQSFPQCWSAIPLLLMSPWARCRQWPDRFWTAWRPSGLWPIGRWRHSRGRRRTTQSGFGPGPSRSGPAEPQRERGGGETSWGSLGCSRYPLGAVDSAGDCWQPFKNEKHWVGQSPLRVGRKCPTAPLNAKIAQRCG